MPAYAAQKLIHGIVKECHGQFSKLPKHGKPIKRDNGQVEWTILAGIVMATPSILQSAQSDRAEEEMWEVECISLATGSKCLPQGKQSPRGDLLNDCHAEVLARRGFNRWCLQEMQTSIENPHCPRNKFRYAGNEHSGTDNDKPVFQLVDPRTQFHLYVSQAPCGDATTASLANIQTEESRASFINGQQGRTDATVDSSARSQSPSQSQSRIQGIESGLKRGREEIEDGKSDQDTSSSSKHPRTDNIKSPHTTQSVSSIDEHGYHHGLGFRRGRIDYDSVGVLRTKPGRVDSEPTMSMSCSDKIARWNILGLTSALVVPFLSPIYLNSVITRELFDATSLKRALFERIMDRQCSEDILEDDSESINGQPYKPHRIKIYESDITFEFSKEVVTEQCKSLAVNALPVPSPCSISWIAYDPLKTEVIVNGCKGGASTKKKLPPKARSKLCKLSMFKASVDLWKSLPRKPDLGRRLTESGQDPDKITYSQWKKLAEDYIEAKEDLFKGVFRNWVKNDVSLEEFNLLGEPSLKP